MPLANSDRALIDWLNVYKTQAHPDFPIITVMRRVKTVAQVVKQLDRIAVR